MERNNLNKSELHKSVYNIVRECYPGEPIREEEPIKIGYQTLFIDIYLPRLKIAFECNGQQHYKFNKFFHSDIGSFRKQKKNDEIKSNFCASNNITLISIRYDEKLTKELIQDKLIEEMKRGNK